MKQGMAFFAVCMIILSSCGIFTTLGSNGGTSNGKGPVSTDARILQFSIKSLQHTVYGTDTFSVVAEIDEERKRITAIIPDTTDITTLDIDVQLSEGVRLIIPSGESYIAADDVTPISLSAIDATGQLELKVTAGVNTNTYTIVVTKVAQGFIPIFVEAHFDYVRDNLTSNYILMNDIALTDDFAPIGNQNAMFNGIFAGNEKRISNLKTPKSSEYYIGFFGVIGLNGEVRNLVLELAGGDENNPDVQGHTYVGSLVGRNYGRITNVVGIGGFVSGSFYVGGLVGNNASTGDIEESYATGTVSGSSSYIGGLVGHNDGDITKSYATGDLPGNSSYAGGLVGKNGTGSSIMDSYATGNLTAGNSRVGGLVGDNYGSVTRSYATGDVSGNGRVGGLVGYNYTTKTITESYATGKVEGEIEHIGGLVGENYGDIINSYATGAVEGAKDFVGGLAGSLYGSIERSYSTGTVVGSGTYLGGLVGFHNTGRIEMSYFDAILATPSTRAELYPAAGGIADLSGIVTYYTVDGSVRVGNSASAAAVKQGDFSDLDFTAVWQLSNDGQWPILQWQGS